jgi:hypothetical protein
MSDGYAEFLQAQIKEEVIQGYLRERLILEEEKKEFQQELEAFRAKKAEVGRRRDELACLLLSPDRYAAFFALIGFDPPPLAWIEPAQDAPQGPVCPPGLSPKGFTRRRRYLNLVRKTYSRLARKAAEAGRASKAVLALAEEINEDVRSFERNYDILNIIRFLRGLDTDAALKTRLMGENFTPRELNSAYDHMAIPLIDPGKEGLRPWPDLPKAQEVEEKTRQFLSEIFRVEREAIGPAVA